MNKLKVSIITVVYNGAATIERTIQSVLQQSYQDIEYIIIDGQSNDGTVAIIEEYRSSLAQFVSAADNGIYDAINKGIALATGDLIGIINSDDWYEEDAVTNVVKCYYENPDVSIFHGLLSYWTAKREIHSISGHHSSFLKSWMIEHPACFVKRELYQRIGLFNLAYKFCADYDFMLRAFFAQEKFFLIPVVLANFSSGGVSSTYLCTKEALALQRKYKLISVFKQYRRLMYWKLKHDK